MTKSGVLKVEVNVYTVYKELDFGITAIRYAHFMTTERDQSVWARRLAPLCRSCRLPLGGTEGGQDLLFRPTVAEKAPTDYLKEPKYLTSRDLPSIAPSVKKRVVSGGKWRKDE